MCVYFKDKIGLYGVDIFFKSVSIIFIKWFEHSKANKAAIIAFYTLFSFAPLIFLSASILGLFFSESFIKEKILTEAAAMIGYEANNLIQIFLDNSSSATKISLLTILLLYSSSVVFSQLKSAMNMIWFDNNLPEPESKIKSILLFLEEKLYSLLVAPFMIFLFVVNAFARSAMSYLLHNIESDFKSIAFNINIFEIIFSVLASALVFFLILRYLPKWKASIKNCFYASIVVTIFYEIGRSLFGIYLGHTQLTNLYGSLSSFVVFMIWIFYLSHIFLFGVEVLRFLEKGED